MMRAIVGRTAGGVDHRRVLTGALVGLVAGFVLASVARTIVIVPGSPSTSRPDDPQPSSSDSES